MDGTEDGCPAVTAGLPTVPTGPRCQHLRLLKLQGEAADIKEACKTQQTVSDLLACLSDNDAQHSTLPDLRPLRLTHPTNWHEHAKGLCECVVAPLLLIECSVFWKHRRVLCAQPEQLLVTVQASRNIPGSSKARRRRKHDAGSVPH